MIASLVEDFENCSVSTSDSIVSAGTRSLIQGLNSEASAESLEERVKYYLAAHNCLNIIFMKQKQKPMPLTEFIGRLNNIYRIPAFQIGTLQGKVFVFENDEFVLKERTDHTTQIKREIHAHLGYSESYASCKGHIGSAFYAYKTAMNTQVNLMQFLQYLKEFAVTNIPIEKPNKKCKPKMVCDLDTNTFSYTVDGSEIVAPVPQKPPLVVDLDKVNAVLTELNLTEENQLCYVPEDQEENLVVYMKNKVVHYEHAEKTQAWFVQNIIGYRKNPKTKKHEYLIKWQSYDYQFDFDDSWETLTNITNCASLIIGYHRSKANLGRYRKKIYEDRIAKKKAENGELLASGEKEKDVEAIKNFEMPRVTNNEEDLAYTRAVPERLVKKPNREMPERLVKKPRLA